jgi:hypothetical protein
MATDRTVFHVTPYVNSWKVKAEGAGPYEFEAVMDTKEDAVRTAKEHARKLEPSQVIIHNKDGKISEESTYGDDPTSSPG